MDREREKKGLATEERLIRIAKDSRMEKPVNGERGREEMEGEGGEDLFRGGCRKRLA